MPLCLVSSAMLAKLAPLGCRALDAKHVCAPSPWRHAGDGRWRRGPGKSAGEVREQPHARQRDPVRMASMRAGHTSCYMVATGAEQSLLNVDACMQCTRLGVLKHLLLSPSASQVHVRHHQPGHPVHAHGAAGAPRREALQHRAGACDASSVPGRLRLDALCLYACAPQCSALGASCVCYALNQVAGGVMAASESGKHADLPTYTAPGSHPIFPTLCFTVL